MTSSSSASGPAADPSGPAADSSGPAPDPSGPAADASGPAADPSGPAPDPSGPAADSSGPTAEQFQTVHRSERFQQLRTTFRSFAFPMTAAFLVWYLAYVLLSTYVEGFMAIRLLGSVTLGIVLGISQFLMTFLITWLYIRHANRKLDPISTQIRDELEGDL